MDYDCTDSEDEREAEAQKQKGLSANSMVHKKACNFKYVFQIICSQISADLIICGATVNASFGPQPVLLSALVLQALFLRAKR